MKLYKKMLLLLFTYHWLLSASVDIETMYKNLPVLVTGGCGFIGSHLVEKLVALGANVTVLDNLSSGNKTNVAAVENEIIYIYGDITDFDTCLQATHGKKIIFHLAAFVSVPVSVEDPYFCHVTNNCGTYNILEAARINNVKRVVFSSSCAVYGELSGVCSETTPPSPISPYGFSKLTGEIYCTEYARVFDMETVAMRYFNVYGPRQNPHGSYAGVVAKFSYNMERGLPIVIFGDGMQTRDYVPVEDIVQANILLGICEKQAIQGEVFNIATGKNKNLFELIDMLKEKYVNYQGTITFKPARKGDVKHIAADRSKYEALNNLIMNN